ncbi:GIY-YIG nuclease family protein [Bradyrhizobium japonicum]|uniref:GIY-YIG nuclease family protein n=1 Tax=Bradyrhizobium japonicum TaxID=375 RepID=UPI0004B5A516|nr:GIY-YIG nuclease family protein [Bradyrhizobium japonicum]
MAELTEQELHFLYTQRIDESAIMDCSWMRSHGYKWHMEREGYLWCIAPKSCYAGHRLRSRAGHCIQCDTARIAFVKRHHDTAYIYIAGSPQSKVVKIGNAIWPERRVTALNTRDYGGITDWVMLYHAKFEEAGKIEFAAHGRLFVYRRGVKEIFRCNYETAHNALMEATQGYLGEDEWERKWAATSYSFEDNA